MKKLERIKILPFALFQALVLGLIGFLCGVLYSVGGLIIDSLVSAGILSPEAMSTPGLSYGTILAFGALIGMLAIGALVGFLTGIIEALVYNAYARLFGGLRIDFRN